MELRQERGGSGDAASGGPGGDSAGSSGPSFQYASLVRGASDRDNSYSSGHHSTRQPHSEEASGPSSPAPIYPPWSPEAAVREHSKGLVSTLRWLLPAGLLVIALFVQNLGQYAGTRGYVRWMDMLNRPQEEQSMGKTPTHPVVEAALVDRAVMTFGSGEVSSGFLGMLTCLLPLVWLVWISYQKDLRLWAHMLLAASGLAFLKGFLSWATIVPDAGGWSSCQERVGGDGLNYYRQEMTALRSMEAVIYILALELRGIWAAGEARGSYCTSGFISTPIYVAVVFSLGICDLAYRATRQTHVHTKQRFLVRSVVWVVLAAIVTMNAIMPTVSRQHYTADVVVSLLLSFLLYSNPAIALMAARWSEAASRDGLLGSDSGSVAHELFTSTGLDLEMTTASEEAEPDAKAADVGQVLAVPCAPWCWDEPVYFLRSQPGRLGRPGHEQQDSMMEPQLQEQMAQFKVLEDEHAKRLDEKEATLLAEREKTRRNAVEVAKTELWKFKGRLAEQNRRLEAEEKKLLDEARQRLAETRQRSSQREAKRAKEADCRALAEELVDITQACQQYETDLAEMRPKVQSLLQDSARAAAKIGVAGFLEAAQRNVEKGCTEATEG